jgi:transposase
MMASKEQCTEIVKLYFQTKSLKTVKLKIKRSHPDLEKLNDKTLQRIVKRFEESGSIEDRRHCNPGRPRSARSDANVEQVQTVINETPQRSVRRVLWDITNANSSTSVYRMLKLDLKLKPYKVSIMQHLEDNDISIAHWINSHNDIIVNV